MSSPKATAIDDVNEVSMMLNALHELCIQTTDGVITPGTMEASLKAIVSVATRKLDRVSVALGGTKIGGRYEDDDIRPALLREVSR